MAPARPIDPDPPAAASEATIDALLDLQHDLGKYIRMPIAFLPRDADPAALRRALHKALRQTRSGPGGVRSARDLWRDFEAELGATLGARPGYDSLVAAVETAIAWEGALDDAGATLDRPRIEADLGAVTTAIRELICVLQGSDELAGRDAEEETA